MKTNFLKIILIVISSVVLLLIIFLTYQLIENNPNIRTQNTEITLSSNELLSYTNSKKKTVLKPYINKAIEINGILKEITKREKTYSLLINNGEGNTFVLCEMNKEENDKVKKLKLDENIKVKGVLKGVLLDIILLNCIIIETTANE